MIEMFREGLQGRSFKATLFLYIGSLLALAPVAILISLLWDHQKLLFITPLLVVILVGVEYALSNPVRDLRLIVTFSTVAEPVERNPRKRRSLVVLLAVASYVVAAGVSLTSSLFSYPTLFRTGEEIFFKGLVVIVFVYFVVEGLITGFLKPRSKQDGLHTGRDKPKQ